MLIEETGEVKLAPSLTLSQVSRNRGFPNTRSREIPRYTSILRDILCSGGGDMKAISLKLDARQIKLLEKVSRVSHVPKSVLIRQGIDLVLQQLQADVVSDNFRREVDTLLREDHELLKRLAKT